ncbi:MAG TPA: GspH/FimT family pseudopilin [Thermoanaerobaculia bacterium]|nr:GspH/FimT family pseudopilin [Thermoanaerobaculia bacterium]
MNQSRERGFQLVEVVIVLAIIGLFFTAALPDLMRATARERVRSAAMEITAVMRLARSEAVKRSVRVAVKFERDVDGLYTYCLYADGDGDGVANADIDTGIDPAIRRPRRLEQFGGRVGFGFPPGSVPPDPGDPRRRLGSLDDPIRFNRSDLASFDPIGSGTPGSVYITDHRTELAAVRVLGGSGRVQVLSYDRDADRWRR